VLLALIAGPKACDNTDLTPHLTAEEIETYARRATPVQQVAIVEEHLLVCEQCQVALQEDEEFIRVLREDTKSSLLETRAAKSDIAQD
jgi:hypothetical protein